jgi:hypothetical protein
MDWDVRHFLTRVKTRNATYKYSRNGSVLRLEGSAPRHAEISGLVKEGSQWRSGLIHGERREKLVVLTKRTTPATTFRRPRESGGPGLQALCRLLWIPASAGMTARLVGAKR